MQVKSESGVAHLQLLVLVLLVASIVGVVGWRVMENQNDQAGLDSSSVTATETAAPATIKSNEDLNNAKTYLNQTDLDKDINPSSLDSDVNSLL